MALWGKMAIPPKPDNRWRMRFLHSIRRKRDGGALTRSEITAFAAGLADGSLGGERAAAMAMAIYLKGMDCAETAALTAAMTRSGAVLDWAAADMCR